MRNRLRSQQHTMSQTNCVVWCGGHQRQRSKGGRRTAARTARIFSRYIPTYFFANLFSGLLHLPSLIFVLLLLCLLHQIDKMGRLSLMADADRPEVTMEYGLLMLDKMGAVYCQYCPPGFLTCRYPLSIIWPIDTSSLWRMCKQINRWDRRESRVAPPIIRRGEGRARYSMRSKVEDRWEVQMNTDFLSFIFNFYNCCDRRKSWVAPPPPLSSIYYLARGGQGAVLPWDRRKRTGEWCVW